MNLKPAWFTEQVPAQSVLHKETLSQKQTKKNAICQVIAGRYLRFHKSTGKAAFILNWFSTKAVQMKSLLGVNIHSKVETKSCIQIVIQ